VKDETKFLPSRATGKVVSIWRACPCPGSGAKDMPSKEKVIT